MPNRPEAQRLQAERPRPANLFAGNFGVPVAAGGAGAGEGAGIGGLAGGQMHFQAGLGFFPSLFGLQFVSDARPLWTARMCDSCLLQLRTYIRSYPSRGAESVSTACGVGAYLAEMARVRFCTKVVGYSARKGSRNVLAPPEASSITPLIPSNHP